METQKIRVTNYDVETVTEYIHVGHRMTLVGKRKTKDVMQVLTDLPTKANCVSWYGHILRKNKNSNL